MLSKLVNPMRGRAERLRSREPGCPVGATRSRRIAWTLALLSPALIAVGRNDAVSGAVVAAIADPASILAARSPGGRGAGALAQSKPARVAATSRGAPSSPTSAPSDFVPSERVLSQVRERPVAPAGAGAPAAGSPDFGTLPLGPVASGFAGPAPTGSGGGAGGLPVGGGSFPSFGGGGGGGGGGAFVPAPVVPPGTGTPPTENPGTGTPTPTPGTPDIGTPTPGTPTPETPVVTPPTVTPPISAVPEPSSWAVMILGFLAIGAALRRRARPPAPVVDAGGR